ncbi:MAG: biotin--[acetyl-CoA-carboxylase] ligase [Solirubrobacteraceae bacterium]|nr:biotin--[acetyl-CoA-carboxylase] ligase [Solirubrobacteraceae bacterium]
MAPFGTPRLHLRETTSTNDRARQLASAGTPTGTVVTASHQTAGRGRQGRTWSAPSGHALLMTVVVRDPPRLLPLVGAVAIAEAIGPEIKIKWPNDLHLDGRKVCGILAEGRPAEGWAVLGAGVNVAVRVEDLPPELHATATTLGRTPADVEPLLQQILSAMQRWLTAPVPDLLDAWRARDALLGREITWSDGTGVAEGIDDAGELLVRTGDGSVVTLHAGEVHLGARATS